jgi:capsule polysaccharide export protein KpsE/RkpR
LFIGILSSRTIADRLIDRFDLRKVYWTKTYMAARKKLSNHASFVEDKKSGLITITVDDRDRARATAMAGAYVEELDRLLSQVNDSASSREREFLEKRLASINVELDDASKKLSEFSSRNATLNPEDQAKAMLDSAALLEGQLIGAKSELSGLQQIYSDQNVRVRSLEAHIAELQQQLNAFGGKNYSGSTQLDANTLYPPIRQLPILGREYAVLYRRAKVDEAVFEFLTESYEIARVQEARDTPSVKVLDAARLPEKAAWPPRLLFALGGVGAGFLFSIGLILGGEYWASIDPREPYKAFWSRELLPSLRRRFASMGKRWRTPRSPFPGSSEPEDASRTDA